MSYEVEPTMKNTARPLLFLSLTFTLAMSLVLASACSRPTPDHSERGASQGSVASTISSTAEGTPSTTTPAVVVCDAGLLWESARTALRLDPTDPGYSNGTSPGVLRHQCAADWAEGCASRPLTGCTDILDLWHWTNSSWTYIGAIGAPSASCLMRDKGVSEEAIVVFFEKSDPAIDANLCSYPPPSPVLSLIAQVEELDGRCRRISNDPQACDERDALYLQIESQGWCYDDANLIVAAWHWHRCGDSSEPIDWDRYNAWAPGH